jgi:hypothetical protein
MCDFLSFDSIKKVRVWTVVFFFFLFFLNLTKVCKIVLAYSHVCGLVLGYPSPLHMAKRNR